MKDNKSPSFVSKGASDRKFETVIRETESADDDKESDYVYSRSGYGGDVAS